MFSRALAVLIVALSLAGCVTATNSLPVEEISAFRLDGVTIEYAQGGSIWWGDGEREYAVSKGLSPLQSESVANTPEAVAYVREGIAKRLRAGFQRHLGPALKGSRPVRLQVVVRDIHIASAAQRIVFGGGHILTADVSLVDAKTGALLLAFPQQTATKGAGGGVLGVALDNIILKDPIDRVTDGYAEQYADWLLRK